LEGNLWLQVWSMKKWTILAFALFLIVIGLSILLKDRLSKNRVLAKALRYTILAMSFVYVGLVLKAQPTTTNIVIMANSLKEGSFPMGLFLMEPYIFLSFVFIALVILIWGRGVFCGWLCPFGAMIELFYKVRKRLLPRLQYQLPYKFHKRGVYLKYLIFLAILAVSFYNFILSEYLTEVEPFRTFVLKLNRQWYFVAYFVAVVIVSAVVFRAFCKYLCPLGAALAVPAFIKKIPFVHLRRHGLCSRCKICYRDCEAQAIYYENGKINMRECLYCLDCQINYWDRQVCPALKKHS